MTDCRGNFLGRRERKKVPAMDELAGKEKERLGTGLNGDGFVKRSIPRRRGRRDLPCCGGG